MAKIDMGKLERIIKSLPTGGSPIKALEMGLSKINFHYVNGSFTEAVKYAADISGKKAIEFRDENIETKWLPSCRIPTSHPGGLVSYSKEPPQLMTIKGSSIFITCALYDFVNQDAAITDFMKDYFENHKFNKNDLIGSFYTDRSYSSSTNLMMALIAAENAGREYAPKIIRGIESLKKDGKRMRFISRQTLDEDIDKLKGLTNGEVVNEIESQLQDCVGPWLTSRIENIPGINPRYLPGIKPKA